MSARELITENIDLWTSTIKAKNTQGRGSSKKRELYGVKKLRELILELAVRGKLVVQDPNDEPASELLERIAAEKEQLIKDEKIRKQKPLSEISDEEKPFEIPSGWAWARLGDLCDTKTGYAFKSGQYVDEGTFVLRVTNIEPNGKVIKVDNKYIDSLSAETEYNRFLLEPDDILLVMVGGSLGKIGVVSIDDLPAVLNQNMWRFVRFDGVDKNYFIHGLKLINSSQITITKSTHGHLSQGDYLSKFFPLPPEKEQHRIVAKVDELMALCDQLEQQTESSLDAHKLLVDTLLSTLTDARDANELSDNWARLADHFNTLITTDYAVEQLKQTILQLAVQGKLVPQDPNDEPASELLKRISAEKEQLVKEKKIRRQKIQAISADCQVYELPQGWSWAQLGELVASEDNAMCDGPFGSKLKTEHYIDEKGFAVVRLGNIGVGKFLWGKEGHISKKHYETLKNNHMQVGDLIVAGMAEPLIRCCEVPPTLGPAVNKADCFKLRLHGCLEKKYISHYLNSPISKLFAAEENQGMTRQRINLGKCKAIPVPIPPTKEQYRIVDKVDELMTLCNQLKTQLNDAQTTQLHLADAVIDNALAV